MTDGERFEEALKSGDLTELGKLYKQLNKQLKGKLLSTWSSEDSGLPALHIAIEAGQAGVINFLLSKGADPNQVDDIKTTPLVLAAIKGHQEIVRNLLQQKKVDVNRANIDETSALHYLVRRSPSSLQQLNDLTDLWRLCMKRKCDVNAKNHWGETPMHQATRSGNTQAITFLVNEGADINAVNVKGESPLHYAVMMGDEDMVNQLLQLRASKDITNQGGLSPCDLAKEQRREEILQMMLEFDPSGDIESKQKANLMRKLMKMVALFNKHVFLARACANVIDKAEVDAFAKAILHISLPAGTIMAVLRELIHGEFLGVADGDSSAVLRGNSVASKVMGLLSRRIAQDFLQNALRETVLALVTKESLDFEMDPTKVSVDPGESAEAICDHNRETYVGYAEQLINRLTGEDQVRLIPRDIRAIANFIAEYARKYCPERENQLVGGFLLLRLVNPTLVTPESYNMLPIGKVPSVRARRNLLMLTKLLQQLSNCVEFGSKEKHMSPLNDYMNSKREIMDAFLLEVASDPDAGPGEENFADCKHVTIRDTSANMFDQQPLLVLHRVLYEYADGLGTYLAAAREAGELDEKSYSGILAGIRTAKSWGAPDVLTATVE